MRVLIVDDVPTMRHFLTMCLGGFANLEVETAGDGLEALRLGTETPCDLILLDLNLPLMDGLSVLRALRSREDTQRTPIIVISTSADERTRELVDQLGAGFLSKPVDAFELQRSVRSALRIDSKAGTSAIERRSAPRLESRINIEIVDGNKTCPVIGENVNALGAFIRGSSLPNVGDVGLAVLRFPHLGEPLRVEFTVVHVRFGDSTGLPGGFGIRFEPTDASLSVALVKAFRSPNA